MNHIRDKTNTYVSSISKHVQRVSAMGTGWLVATSQIHTYDTYMILLRLGKYGHNYLGYLLIKIVMYGINIMPYRCGRLDAYLPTSLPT